MPTIPLPQILPQVRPDIKSILDRLGKLIDETQAFGTHVLHWHMEAAVGGDEVLPISLSIRHILEMMGAISSCVKNSNIDPCKILLRATLESFLGLAYMLKEDTRRRAFSFLATEAQQRLKHVRMLDPSTQEGERYLNAMKDDTIGSGFSHEISHDVITSAIHNTEEFLKTDGVKEAVNEIAAMKKSQRKNNPNWYSLHGGPPNLEGLATALGYQSLYLVFYKYWSRTTHGIDVVQGKLGKGTSGRPGIVQLRVPAEAQTATQVTVSVAMSTYRIVVAKYCPTKSAELKNWYTSEIMEEFVALTQGKLINVIVPR